MLSLIFDGMRGDAKVVGSIESEQTALTAALILGHFADSDVNSAAMIRGGALGTLKRALKERRTAAGTVDDVMSRLVREVMGKLVNDTDTGAEFMRTAMRAAAAR